MQKTSSCGSARGVGVNILEEKLARRPRAWSGPSVAISQEEHDQLSQGLWSLLAEWGHLRIHK